MKRVGFAALLIPVALTLAVPVGADDRQPPQRLQSRRLASLTDNPRSVGRPMLHNRRTGAPPPSFGFDNSVNPGTGDDAYPHQSFSVAADPTNAENFISGSNDWTLDFTSFSGAYRSSDGGETWAGGNLPCDLPPTGSTCPQGDAFVDFDGNGTAWMSTLCYGPDDYSGGICVLRSDDKGETWGNAVLIAENTPDGFTFWDRPSMVIDRRTDGPNPGRIYVAATKFVTDEQFIYEGYIWLIYSDDGVNWSMTRVTPEEQLFGNQAPHVTVGRNGSVYVGYEYYENYCNDNVILYVNRSNDGGETFLGQSEIGGGPVTPAGLIDPNCSNGGSTRQLLLASSEYELRIRTSPILAVHAHSDEHMFAVWADGRWGDEYSWTDPDTGIEFSGRHSDIAFSFSSNGGTSWTDPVRVNDDGDLSRDQFMPWVATQWSGQDSTIHVTYLDRRSEINDGEYLYNESYQYSTDHGANWSAFQRVSDASSDPAWVTFQDTFTLESYGYLGDYDQTYADATNIVPMWIDTRSGTGDFVQNQFTDTGSMNPTSVTLTNATAQTSNSTLPLLAVVALGAALLVGLRMSKRAR